VFLDIATLRVQAGKGGDGAISTRREKFVPRGGPDGGNGGQGGSVYLVAEVELTTLLDFRYQKDCKAGVGQPGGGNRRTGAAGEDLIIPVPCGTSVFRVEDDVLLGDLTESGQRLCVARGGAPGRGNWMFRSARNQTPMKKTPGKPGEYVEVRLELRLIADIGLVGAPNAGKSTLLSVITAAQPKVANYPFTTLVPNLGIVDLGGYASCTLADIPGLIEGASDGKGLGHEFLRHIERNSALLLMADAGDGDPGAALDMLRKELEKYGNRLIDLPFAVVLTKADLLDEETQAEALAVGKQWCEAHGGHSTQFISAVRGDGLDDLKRLLAALREAGRAGDEPEPRPYNPLD